MMSIAPPIKTKLCVSVGVNKFREGDVRTCYLTMVKHFFLNINKKRKERKKKRRNEKISPTNEEKGKMTND